MSLRIRLVSDGYGPAVSVGVTAHAAFVELPLELTAPENGPDAQRHREPPAFQPHDCYTSDRWTMRVIAADSRVQFAVSDSSCFLPRRVSE